MRTIAVIPARFQSKRLPGKPLADIHGKTLIEHVYRRAAQATRVTRVLVATDDERIFDAVSDFGGEAVMTSKEHPSGSDRIAEAVAGIDVDLVVNVQGDEPLIAPQAIDEAVQLAEQTQMAAQGVALGAIVTLKSAIVDRQTLLDRNAVKVVTDSNGFALYFSRSPIPAVPVGGDDELPPNLYYKHIGLYVYPKAVLLELTRIAPSPLELAERLEQLRALENGIRIRLGETVHDSLGVDSEEDLEAVRALIAARVTVQ
ncbi:MAG: 3-deoxy-manno-octulosonate cytidylyltransferase [Acidobacteriota bacterium]|nr:MAG: 3-deoxy-manno-octulosonate cytidylyltransferase [Acidobacteriota bacterium]